MKVVVVQPLLPHYSIAFFNRIVELHPDVQLVVLADIATRNGLNQYRTEHCRFEVVHLANVEKSGVAFRPGLLRLLARQQADVVVFSATPRDFSQILALVLYRLLGRKAVAWGMFHRIGGPRFISTIYFKLAGRFATRCLTYTRVGATNLISLGVPKHKIGIVGTAIDERVPLAQREARTPQELATFRTLQGLDGKHVVLQVVRLSRIKRPELLVLAAEQLLRQRQDLIFVLIGQGEMRAELERMVAERGMQQAFRFMGPIYDEEQLSYWYMNADVFVVPTCIGLSAHHAMCYGVPVVTDDSLDSQASEFFILANGLNCKIYKEGNASHLADQLLSIVTNDALRKSLEANCITTISIHNIKSKANNFINKLRSDF